MAMESSVKTNTLLVTGSSGLIESEVCLYFARRGFRVHGIDNNQREVLFGSHGTTRWNQVRLVKALGGDFTHHEVDIRERAGVCNIVRAVQRGV